MNNYFVVAAPLVQSISVSNPCFLINLILFSRAILKIQKTLCVSISCSNLHYSVTVISRQCRSRLAFNSNGSTTYACKWNTNKLQNVTNKSMLKPQLMCD